MNPSSGAALAQQIQPFDPYAAPGGLLNTPPVTAPYATPPAATYPSLPGGAYPGPPATNLPPITVPNGAFPPMLPPGNAPNAYGVPVFPSGAPAAGMNPYLPPGYQAPVYQQPPPLGAATTPIQPTPVFPNGIAWNDPNSRWERLMQDTGVLYTYLYSDGSPDALGDNEVEVFTSFVWKNFLRGPNDLRVTPGFIFDFLDGPAVPGGIDLPPQLYSAYLNFLWQPQLAPQFGADLNFRVGVYSDFNTFTSHSLRYTGRALGVLQMTPTTAFKFGIEYLDRVDIKLFPAVGIFWQPNERTRFDIYFPRPKYSHYWTCWGNNELWWHIGAEYGGSSWTIDRIDNGNSDQIDINDIRVFIGTDWNRLDRMDGIFEVGYVFNREIVVRSDPADDLDLTDTFMIRTGLKF